MAPSNSKVILYSYWRSSCSWRVRAALAIKKIPYEYVDVNLVKEGGQQYTDEYTAINPARLVPALHIDGHTLGESMAMLEYLEDTRPEHPLLPKDAYGKAQVRAMSLQIVAGIQPLQNLPVLNKVGETKNEWAQHWIARGLQGLERMLAKTAGKYSYGDTLTMLDCCLAPQIYNAIRFNLDLLPFPICKRIYDDLLKVEEFRISHPANQPDTPESDKGKI